MHNTISIRLITMDYMTKKTCSSITDPTNVDMCTTSVHGEYPGCNVINDPVYALKKVGPGHSTTVLD